MPAKWPRNCFLGSRDRLDRIKQRPPGKSGCTPASSRSIQARVEANRAARDGPNVQGGWSTLGRHQHHLIAATFWRTAGRS